MRHKKMFAARLKSGSSRKKSYDSVEFFWGAAQVNVEGTADGIEWNVSTDDDAGSGTAHGVDEAAEDIAGFLNSLDGYDPVSQEDILDELDYYELEARRAHRKRAHFEDWHIKGDLMEKDFDGGWMGYAFSDGTAQLWYAPEEKLWDEHVGSGTGDSYGYENFATAMELCEKFYGKRMGMMQARNRRRADFWNPSEMEQRLMDIDNQIWDANGWQSGNVFYEDGDYYHRSGENWELYKEQLDEMLRYPDSGEPITFVDADTMLGLEDSNYHSLTTALEELGYGTF